MRDIWKAFKYWIISPLVPPAPGNCECGHARCAHKRGRGACVAVIDEREGECVYIACACQIYIYGGDDNGGDDLIPTPAPGIDELERIIRP